MNTIALNVHNIERPEWSDHLAAFCEKMLKHLERENWEISLVLCDDDFIRTLNREYRDKDSPTDVLSFTQDEMDVEEDGVFYAGDIIISLDSLKYNSIQFDVPEDEELKRLALHGILHLDGWDHETNNADEPMLKKQEEILKHFSEERIIY